MNKPALPAPIDAHHPCGKCAFYQQSVWQPVAPGSISVLSAGFSRKALDVGQVLFDQDGKNRGVYCVSKGLIAIRAHHAKGASTLLKLAYPGEIIGFRSFLENTRHKTQAIALRPSRAFCVAQRDAAQVVHGNASVLARPTSRCIAEIDHSHERIIAMVTTPNKQRLSDLLRRLIQAHGERVGDHMQVHLPLSRSDLADLIGVQPETMSRLFKRLKDDGVFIVSGRDIRMPIAPPLEPGAGRQSGRIA